MALAGTDRPNECLPIESAELDYHLYELVKPIDKKSGGLKVELTRSLLTPRKAAPILTEYIDARWLAPAELMGLDWPPTDVPAAQSVMRDLNQP